MLTLTIVPDAALQKAVIIRWGNVGTTDRQYTQIPFGGYFTEERTVDGYTSPIRLNVDWWSDTERYPEFEFFRVEIPQTQYH